MGIEEEGMKIAQHIAEVEALDEDEREGLVELLFNDPARFLEEYGHLLSRSQRQLLGGA